MKKLLNDFKDFLTQGNVVDLAIGIIIGSAFSTIVNSVVENLMMPPLGLLLGNVDTSDLYIVLRQGEKVLPSGATLQMARDTGAVTFNYGQFLTDLVSFLIVALGVFLIVKGITSLKENVKKPETAEGETPTEKECPFCQKLIPINASRYPYCTSHLEDIGR
ncbi:MAG: large conductance mechanosensitive channel protein MscL [Chloroflexota bacterium]|nr:large conductance mechanosensitive channel protein MscL [Chloroflexota bacterium]